MPIKFKILRFVTIIIAVKGEKCRHIKNIVRYIDKLQIMIYDKQKELGERTKVSTNDNYTSAKGGAQLNEINGAPKLLSVRGVTKAFGTNKVLKSVALDLEQGEILALIGGNGAGKSTLMKIIMGIYQPDSGEISINGKITAMTKPSVALSSGIYMVPQEPMLFPNMTVEENITMGFNDSQRELRNRLKNIMEDIGWKFDLGRKANSLSIAEQTLVEILRALLREAKVLILDEPTSALTFDEVESFFRVIEDLRKKGIGIIYITHRLAEVFEIATHVSIMVDGIITLHGPVGDFNREMLVKSLMPPNAEHAESKASACKVMNYDGKKPVFELSNFSGYGFNDISLKIYPGEILGVAGVVGAGRTELVSTIFGRDKVLGGRAILDGKDITGMKTKDVLKSGINYVPEDRYLYGIYGISTVGANMSSANLSSKTLGNFILNRKNEHALAQTYIDNFRIKVTDQEQLMSSLSGGNQQKVVIGRSLSTKPKLVIMDEPTRGIDAAARGDIYSIIQKLRDEGVAILLVSSDMEEIIELADRAVCVFQGRINAELCKEEITQDNLTSASFGVVTGKEATV